MFLRGALGDEEILWFMQKIKFGNPNQLRPHLSRTLQKSHLVANFSAIQAVSRLSLLISKRHVRKHPSGRIFFASRTSTNKKFIWITKQDDEEEAGNTQPENKLVQWHKKTKKVRILFSVMCPEGEECLKRNSKIAFEGVGGRRKANFAPRSRVSRQMECRSSPQEPINFILSSVFNLFDKKSISGRLQELWLMRMAHEICLFWRSLTPKW